LANKGLGGVYKKGFVLTRNLAVSRPLEPKKRAIVVGASSGVGADLVRSLVGEGYLVAALGRREKLLTEVCAAAANEAPDGAIAIPYVHDVTDYDAVPDLFAQIVREMGGLDLVVYMAAVQKPVTPDEYEFSKDRLMVQTNLLGAIAWLNLAAIRFQRSKGGHIVGVSSIAGERGRVAGPAYGTSKAALNTYLEALRNRLSRHGVTVTTIRPGFVDTALLKNAAKPFWVISPHEAAQQITKAIQRKRQTVYVPARWRLVSLVIRHIPSFLFRRLSI
jgi:NAD(P)-dependent dehydrogenase (short-subunit alcohol dehydrogenase family)